MGLADDIDELMRAPVQRTTLGLAGWIEGPEGVQRGYDDMDFQTRINARLELLHAMCDGQTAAIRRLAEEIEKHGG